MWGGKVIDSMFRMCQYTGYSSRYIENMLDSGKSIDDIFIGSSVGSSVFYYPQIYMGRVIINDKQAGEVCGVSEKAIQHQRLKGKSIEHYMSDHIKRDSSRSKNIVLEFARGLGCDSYEDFQGKYNTCGSYSDRLISSWIKKNRGTEFVLRKLRTIQYPYTYYGIVYNSDKEVANKFNLPETTVNSRRNRGFEFKDIIKEKKLYADGYPFTTEDGITVYTDEQMAKLCGQSIYWVRNRRHYGYSYLEMYMGSVGEPIKSDTKQVKNGVFVDGALWYKSTADCVNRMGLSEFYSSISKLDDINEGLGRAFVKFAEKYNKGYVTPELRVDHYTHEYEGSRYYCCFLNEEVEYFNAKEILDLRLHYVKYKPESKIYRNNGIFNQLRQAAVFYNVYDSSIRRRVEREGVSFDEAISGLAFNKCGTKFVEVNGVMYNGYKDCSNKNNIHPRTLRSRLLTGKLDKSEVLSTPVVGSFKTIEVDKYENGVLSGKQVVSYDTLKTLELKLGFRNHSISNRKIEKGIGLEKACNLLLAEISEYWIPYTSKVFYSVKDVCSELGLNYDRALKASKKGKGYGLTFYESLKRYYFESQKCFEMQKDAFTIKYNDCSVSSLIEMVDIGDDRLYHYLTMPNKTVRVLSFDDLFAILVKNRLGR